MRSIVIFFILILTLDAILSISISANRSDGLGSEVKAIADASSYQSWWDTRWTYRRQINVTSTTLPLTNFPIEFIFRHDGKAQQNGSDIRIIDGSLEVPYVLTALNSTTATILFETSVPDPLSVKSLLVYYGNPGASAPNYILVPFKVSGGSQNGYAIIDNNIYIGWENVPWGIQPGLYMVLGEEAYIDNNDAVVWTDFRMDFNHDGLFGSNEDLIRDVPNYRGAIGRYHTASNPYDEFSYGLGDFQGYVRTPIYVDLIFTNARLRVYRSQNFVETTQADRLTMFSAQWDRAKVGVGAERNIVDGLDTLPNSFSVLYSSPIVPPWIAFRDSATGYVFGGIGFGIDLTYKYFSDANEAYEWNREILYDIRYNFSAPGPLEPFDQPASCRIYWYGDSSNSYRDIDRLSQTLTNMPSIVVSAQFSSKTPSSISCIPSPQSITIGSTVAIFGSTTPHLQGVSITISYRNFDAWNTLAVVASDADGSYSYDWHPANVGVYQIRAAWPGNDSYDEAISDIASVTVSKVATSISCLASPSDVTEGSSVIVSGALNPALSIKIVTLNYTKPDGSTVTRTATTIADGSYSDNFKTEGSGSWSVVASWSGDATHQGASSSSASFKSEKKPGCLIATATYGSELSPEVQFLRSFRDGTVLNTFAGSRFMIAFNGFYYSFSPSIASTITGNNPLMTGMRVILYPLMGILHLSQAVFSLFSFNAEIGVVMAGLVASSLIAIVYITPFALLIAMLKRFKPPAKVIQLISLTWVGSIFAMAIAEMTMSSLLMMASSGTFVVATICLTTLIAVKVAAGHLIPRTM